MSHKNLEKPGTPEHQWNSADPQPNPQPYSQNLYLKPSSYILSPSSRSRGLHLTAPHKPARTEVFAFLKAVIFMLLLTRVYIGFRKSAHTHTCMHQWINACFCRSWHVHGTHTHSHSRTTWAAIATYIHTYILTYLHSCSPTYLLADLPTYMCICRHTCMHAYIHASTHSIWHHTMPCHVMPYFTIPIHDIT